VIVVGVDGSPESLAALRFAIAEARLRGCGVKAVAAWRLPGSAYGGGIAPYLPDPREFERAARDALEQALAAVASEAEGVTVRAVVLEGDAAHVLVEESEGAVQLVVGCRNLGFVGRLLQASVSGHCARDAHCPVTVVHA